MKCYDFDAATWNGDIYCLGCLPKGITKDHDEVNPIFANSEWDYVPTCCICGTEHDYVTVLKKENKRLSDNFKGYVVSEATLLTKDLISSIQGFLDAEDISYKDEVPKGAWDYEDHPYWQSEDASFYLNEDLFDLMNNIAPKGCYFGASEGDGALFGFWQVEEEEGNA